MRWSIPRGTEGHRCRTDFTNTTQPPVHSPGYRRTTVQSRFFTNTTAAEGGVYSAGRDYTTWMDIPKVLWRPRVKSRPSWLRLGTSPITLNGKNSKFSKLVMLEVFNNVGVFNNAASQAPLQIRKTSPRSWMYEKHRKTAIRKKRPNQYDHETKAWSSLIATSSTSVNALNPWVPSWTFMYTRALRRSISATVHDTAVYPAALKRFRALVILPVQFFFCEPSQGEVVCRF